MGGENSLKNSKLTSQKCRFCREFLAEEIDDLTHLICSHCWQVINEIFYIGGFSSQENKRLNEEK